MTRLFQCLIIMMLVLLYTETPAASFRCGRMLLKVDESTNALIKKCGKPARKYSSKETITEQGNQRRIGVSNWVYTRRGKRDMIVSVYSGTVVKIQVD